MQNVQSWTQSIFKLRCYHQIQKDLVLTLFQSLHASAFEYAGI